MVVVDVDEAVAAEKTAVGDLEMTVAAAVAVEAEDASETEVDSAAAVVADRERERPTTQCPPISVASSSEKVRAALFQRASSVRCHQGLGQDLETGCPIL